MADAQAVSSVALNVKQDALPYQPSWPDRIVNRVRKLPVPAWLFYLGLAAVIALVETLVKWYDGTYPVGTVWLFHLALALPVPYSLAVRHYINDAAGLALDSSSATLNLDDSACLDLRYRLTNAPARSTALLTLAAVLLAAMLALIVALPYGPTRGWSLALPAYVKMMTSPVASVSDILLLVGIWAALGANLFWVIRLLRMVHEIYAQYAHVDIYRITSLYAFSGLTARVALCLLAGLYAANLLYSGANSPTLAMQAFRWAATLLGTAVAAAAFVWPLYGVHRILERQKGILLDENGEKIKSASEMMHQGVAIKKLDEMVPLKHAMDSLVAERGILQGLRTWPWQHETFRWMSTAVLLPVVVFVIQKLIAPLLGP